MKTNNEKFADIVIICIEIISTLRDRVEQYLMQLTITNKI